jgi:lipoprotein plp4
LFDFDKAELRAEGKQVVATLADKRNSLNVKASTIEGYTDRMGQFLTI